MGSSVAKCDSAVDIIIDGKSMVLCTHPDKCHFKDTYEYQEGGMKQVKNICKKKGVE